MKTRFVFSLVTALTLMALIPTAANAVGVGKTCGGIFGEPCNAGLFCQYKPGTCGRFDLTGICAVKPRFCPQITGPKLVVCGCDGKTFFNDCARRSAGVSLAHKGKCE
jgi:hypothetical protein